MDQRKQDARVCACDRTQFAAEADSKPDLRRFTEAYRPS